MTEKYEWKKSEPWYKPLKKPQIFQLPPQNFISIHGLGDPNQPEFAEKIPALYATSYTIRMSEKNGFAIPGFYPFTVYPLEGYWSVQEKYWHQPLKKEHFEYDIMIKQPAFVTPEIFVAAREKASGKIPQHLQTALTFRSEAPMTVAQILHVGSYDDEPATFARLAVFLQEQGYVRSEKEHKEIYLSDPRKTAPEKCKTLLRVKIEKA